MLHLIRKLMTKEEKRQWHQDWYYNRGGKEKRKARLRELGPAKWGTAREVPSKVL